MAIRFIYFGKLPFDSSVAIDFYFAANQLNEHGILLQDFYVDNHWEKMPTSWSQALNNMSPEYLTDLLIPPEQKIEQTIWPLSLLALRQALWRLCISRKPLSFSSQNHVSSYQFESF